MKHIKAHVLLSNRCFEAYESRKVLNALLTNQLQQKSTECAIKQLSTAKDAVKQMKAFVLFSNKIQQKML